MANGIPPQQARKTARGKRPSASLAIISTALAESPLPKRRRFDSGESSTQKNVSELVTFPGNAEPPTQHLSPPTSVPSVRIPPDANTTSGARSGEISNICQRNIIELFAKRYIKNFDKNRPGLKDAYMSEATFSCRHISSSPEPLPSHFTKCNTGTLQGLSEITKALSSFSRHLVFVPEAEFVLDATIDVLQLPDMNYFAVLAFNTIIKGVDVSVDMAFLLKENVGVAEERERTLWTPFAVMSHQIVLRS